MQKPLTLVNTIGLPLIKSSGGLVYNQEHHILLIFKRGSWDLPKGRLEDNEDIEENALREVQEETGLEINKLEIQGKLPSTWHTTQHNKKNYLKKTQWYLMLYHGSDDDVKPQLEEGIIECRWVHLSELKSYQQNLRPRVQYVIDFWHNNLAYAPRH